MRGALAIVVAGIVGILIGIAICTLRGCGDHDPTELPSRLSVITDTVYVDRAPEAGDIPEPATPERVIIYQDRWVNRPAPEEVCDTTLGWRFIPVPDTSGRWALSTARPIAVNSERVAWTYRVAEGPDAGQTRTEVFRVPRRRWDWQLGATYDYVHGAEPAHMAGVAATFRVGPVTGRAGVGVDVTGSVHTRAGLELRLIGR